MDSMLTTAPPTRTPIGERQSRHYELDWCRAFVVLVLIPFHAAGLFTATADQYFGTRSSSPVSLSLLTTVGVWGISLLFLIAGAGACFGMRLRPFPTSARAVNRKAVRVKEQRAERERTGERRERRTRTTTEKHSEV